MMGMFCESMDKKTKQEQLSLQTEPKTQPKENPMKMNTPAATVSKG